MVCKACHVEKPLDEFYPEKKNRSGYRGTCKPCVYKKIAEWQKRNRDKTARYQANWKARRPDYNREQQLARYGLTLATYDELLRSQGGVCAICERECHKNRLLSVDHDHSTGKVRGLLCHNCNAGIGQLGDDPALLRRALEYLEG